MFKLNLITCYYDEINILSIAGAAGFKFESYVHTDKEAITPYISKNILSFECYSRVLSDHKNTQNDFIQEERLNKGPKNMDHKSSR